MSNSVSVVMSVHNQEEIIQDVIYGFLNNMSENVKEIILVVDGCTDSTLYKIDRTLPKFPFPAIMFIENDIWETKANNVGLKASTCDYSLLIQDDMILNEKDFDKRLMKPFMVDENILGVTARNAQNEKIVGNSLSFFDLAGKDMNTPRDLFCVRDVIVRGPILFDNQKLEKLNYLDEDFAPLDSDDKDLSIRAYKDFGWKVGAYVCDYISEVSWGNTRKNHSSMKTLQSASIKNQKLIIERHGEFLNGEKHNENILVP